MATGMAIMGFGGVAMIGAPLAELGRRLADLLAVGIPLAWGVWVTLQKAVVLFR